MIESDEYQLRGQRVEKLEPEAIEKVAQKIVAMFKIKPSVLKKMDVFIEYLWNEHSLNIEMVEDSKWLNVADALCDPSTFTIAMPQSLYFKITKEHDLPSIYILFHEIGHLTLGHKAVLHHATMQPTECEDSEWQADYFAGAVLDILGEYRYKQLTLF